MVELEVRSIVIYIVVLTSKLKKILTFKPYKVILTVYSKETTKAKKL